jgi:hypothetical protein
VKEAAIWRAGQVTEPPVSDLAQAAEPPLTLADHAVLHAQPTAPAVLGPRWTLRQVEEPTSGGMGPVRNDQRLLGPLADAQDADPELPRDEGRAAATHLAHLRGLRFNPLGSPHAPTLDG